MEAIGVGENCPQFVDVGLTEKLVWLSDALLANSEIRSEQHSWREGRRIGDPHEGFEDMAQRSSYSTLCRRIAGVQISRYKRVPAIVFGDAILMDIPGREELSQSHRVE